MTADNELTKRIIGCCFTVHRELRPGFPEQVYHRALELALQKAGLGFESGKRLRVSYQGAEVGEFRVDVLVEKQVLVEIKAVTGMLPKVFSSQVIAYLKAARLPVGLLVNFGNVSCQVRRFVS